MSTRIIHYTEPDDEYCEHALVFVNGKLDKRRQRAGGVSEEAEGEIVPSWLLDDSTVGDSSYAQ